MKICFFWTDAPFSFVIDGIKSLFFPLTLVEKSYLKNNNLIGLLMNQ